VSTGRLNISTVCVSLTMFNEWNSQRRSLESEVVSTGNEIGTHGIRRRDRGDARNCTFEIGDQTDVRIAFADIVAAILDQYIEYRGYRRVGEGLTCSRYPGSRSCYSKPLAGSHLRASRSCCSRYMKCPPSRPRRTCY